MFSAPGIGESPVARCGSTDDSATRNVNCPAIVGYARAHRHAEGLEAQLGALRDAGAARLYSDDAKGAAIIRPGLQAAIAGLSAGDCLAVVSLDRLAWREDGLREVLAAVAGRHAHIRSLSEDFDTRSPSDIFGVMRALDAFADRVRLARAVEAQPTGGIDHRQRIEPAAWAQMRPRIESGEVTPAQAAKALGVARSTILRRQRAEGGA